MVFQTINIEIACLYKKKKTKYRDDSVFSFFAYSVLTKIRVTKHVDYEK